MRRVGRADKPEIVPVELVAGDRISFVGAVAQFTAIAVLSPNDA